MEDLVVPLTLSQLSSLLHQLLNHSLLLRGGTPAVTTCDVVMGNRLGLLDHLSVGDLVVDLGDIEGSTVMAVSIVIVLFEGVLLHALAFRAVGAQRARIAMLVSVRIGVPKVSLTVHCEVYVFTLYSS